MSGRGGWECGECGAWAKAQPLTSTYHGDALRAEALAVLGERDALREALDALCAAVEREKRFSLTPSKHFPMSLNVRTSLEAARAALAGGEPGGPE